MKKTLKQFGFAVLVTAIALSTLSLTGCEDATTPVDPALNGSWLYIYSGENVVFNNGAFESPLNLKGTYTANNGNYSMTMTHLHSDNFLGGPSKWYSKPEVKTALKANYPNSSDAQIDQMINSSIGSMFGIPVSGSTSDVFITLSGTYSISGNTLTLTTSAGTMTLTRN